ncbi:MAG: XRE family transcriptional regulator [Selenomonadaceae bacterium]|nr:XRE family transcriptional regulator [Selenomonadaceae bacterium]
MPIIFNQSTIRKKNNLFNAVQNYIDENYRSPSIFDDLFNGSLDQYYNVPGAAGRPDLFGLNFFLESKEETFSDKLLHLINRKGKTNPEVYKTACITKQHFSRIKNDKNYQPEKSTIISLAIALHLNLDETNDLLKSAGYTLSHSLKQDLIVEYFIVNEFYDLDEINYQLTERGYTALTNRRKLKEDDEW